MAVESRVTQEEIKKEPEKPIDREKVRGARARGPRRGAGVRGCGAGVRGGAPEAARLTRARACAAARRRARCCCACSPPTTAATTAWTSSPAATCRPASCRSTPGERARAGRAGRARACGCPGLGSGALLARGSAPSARLRGMGASGAMEAASKTAPKPRTSGLARRGGAPAAGPAPDHAFPACTLLPHPRPGAVRTPRWAAEGPCGSRKRCTVWGKLSQVVTSQVLGREFHRPPYQPPARHPGRSQLNIADLLQSVGLASMGAAWAPEPLLAGRAL